MVTRIQFILVYSIFLFFLIQISVMAGQNIVTGVEPPDIIKNFNSVPLHSGIVGFFELIGKIVDYFFSSLAYFFTMMKASTTFGIFGAVVLTPFLVALIWAIVEVSRGVGG